MPSAKLNPKPRHSIRFAAIGTQWSIETEYALDRKLLAKIEQRIESFDQTYSRFRDDSLVTKLSEKVGEYDFPTDAEKLIDFYIQLYDVTNGAVSPLVGNVLVEAGYDRNYSLDPGVIHEVPSWDTVMKWQGTHVTMRMPATLDFGAAGKGYLVDKVGELLEANGHMVYVVDASGDIRTRGAMETIGLENPHDTESVIGTMRVKNASICASATNRRAWGEWHHVIDPRTGKPVSEVAATWVTSAETIEADGLATALFFVGPDQLSEWDFEYVRLMTDGRIEHSPGFVGELFL